MIAGMLYPDVRDLSTLGEEQKQTLSTLATISAGMAGGLAGGSTGSAVSGGQAGRNAVENNSLANVLAAAEANNPGSIEKYKAAKEAVCKQDPAGCKQAVETAASMSLDFVPIVGDIKGFAEAQTALDYLAATIGLIPGLGDVAGKTVKAAEKALKNGDIAEASRLINETSQQISVKAKDVQIWTETKKKDPVENAFGHWEKHKTEFPEYQNSKQYVEATHSFVNNPPPGTLVKVRSNGETVLQPGFEYFCC